MHCMECGTCVHRDSLFCFKCGAKQSVNNDAQLKLLGGRRTTNSENPLTGAKLEVNSHPSELKTLPALGVVEKAEPNAVDGANKIFGVLLPVIPILCGALYFGFSRAPKNLVTPTNAVAQQQQSFGYSDDSEAAKVRATSRTSCRQLGIYDIEKCAQNDVNLFNKMRGKQ